MNYIDLRSDTVTKPTPEMRAAMAEAEVGDDVFGDDPTVNRLQEMAANMLGKEAALFVPSGTMGNLIALLVHCRWGDEVLVGDQSHINLFEAEGVSVLGGIRINSIPNQKDGTLLLEDIRAFIASMNTQQPTRHLVCLENTQNNCGGIPLTQAYTREVGELAHENGLSLHLDGARIFNAAVAQHVSVQELVKPADSVMFCLSKGLASPVGSMLVGTYKFIERARHVRKMLGGGMRQAGVIAAAGIISLEKMTGRLREDHVRAKKLVDGLRQVKGLIIDAESPATNVIYVNLAEEVQTSPGQIVEQMKKHGVLLGGGKTRRFRLLTHYLIDDTGIEWTVSAFREVLRQLN